MPIVTTSEGIPTKVMIRPLNRPASAPTPSEAAAPRATLPVACHTNTKPTIPRAMTEGNERSMSPAMMTIVSGIATSAKNGVVWANER